MRIISLLPSATEIIYALGLGDQLVGVSHECDFPMAVQRLPKVTRALIPTEASSRDIDRLVRECLQSSKALYALDFSKLEELKPDVIVTQALCDVCAVAEDEVRSAACRLPTLPRVINLEPQTLDDVFVEIGRVGETLGVSRKAEEVVSELKARVEKIAARTEKLAARTRVAFLEWLDPPFSGGHWSPELVRLAGGQDGLNREGSRSRTLSWDEVFGLQPDVVFVACCGYPIQRALGDVVRLGSIPGWMQMPAVVSGRVYVADGSQYFNRPGPRLVDSLEILAHALHPEVHPLRRGLPCAVQVFRDYNLLQRRPSAASNASASAGPHVPAA